MKKMLALVLALVFALSLSSVAVAEAPITVQFWTVFGGDDGATMQATVADLADGAEGSLVMGCSCATNVAGGGAIMNAQVSGASLASVLAAVIG